MIPGKRTIVCLECRDPARNRFRFYRITVQQSLFGSLTRTPELGRIGSRQPGELHQEFTDEQTMLREVRRILSIRLRHGYLLIQSNLVKDCLNKDGLLESIHIFLEDARQ